MATNIAYHRNFDDTSSTELHADTDEYTEKKHVKPLTNSKKNGWVTTVLS